MPQNTEKKASENFKPYFGLETLHEALSFPPTMSTATPSTFNQNNNSQELPLSEVLKEAARIQEFRGDGHYDVTSFISEVELFTALLEGTHIEEYFFQRHVLKKTQGEAANIIRALKTPNWTEVKQELLRNFGVRESYHQMFHKALDV